MTSSHQGASQHTQELLGAFFKHENAVFNGEQEKESISRVMGEIENPSIGIPICHHSAGLVMPIGDPRDRFSIPPSNL